MQRKEDIENRKILLRNSAIYEGNKRQVELNKDIEKEIEKEKIAIRNLAETDGERIQREWNEAVNAIEDDDESIRNLLLDDVTRSEKLLKP
jgi:hypothetical protein